MNRYFFWLNQIIFTLGELNTDQDNDTYDGEDENNMRTKETRKQKKKANEKCGKGMKSENVTLFSLGFLNTIATP